MAGGGGTLNIYINGTLVLSGEGTTTGNLFAITSTGFKKNNASSNAWTYSGNLAFFGFSLTQGATTARDDLKVGQTIDANSLYSLTNYTGNLYLYSVEGIPDRAISLENLYEFKQKIDETVKYKALYHLGAYDSVDTSNADYDLVTRGTGYIDLGKYTWTYSASDNQCWVTLSDIPDSVNAVCNNYEATKESYVDLVDGQLSTQWLSWGSAPRIIVKNGSSTIAPTGLLEYQLSSTYTERVVKNHPINQLDQAGENWLRGEYEKMLNLWDSGDVVASTGGTHSWQNKRIKKTLPAGTYTIVSTHNGSVGYLGIGIGSTSYVSEGGSDSPHSFTLSQTSEVWFDWYASLGTSIDNTTTYSNIMLNSGSTALPYQPYDEFNGFLKNEYSKTLNLWNASSSWSNSNTDSDSSFYSCVYVKGVIKGEERQASDGFKYITFTTPNETNLYFTWKHNGQERDLFIILNGYVNLEPNKTYTLSYQLNGHYPNSVGGLSISNIMLNEGDTPKPFAEYSGKVMHAIDVEGVKLWENGNPTSGWTDSTVGLSQPWTDFSYLVFEYKRGAGSNDDFQYHKVKAHYGTFDICTYYHGDNGKARTREINILSSYNNIVSIDDGYCGTTKDSGACLVTAIYGIK